MFPSSLPKSMCRQLLVAFEAPAQMAALHFVGAPPELLAQLMPAQLPQLAVSSEGNIYRILSWYYTGTEAQYFPSSFV